MHKSLNFILNFVYDFGVIKGLVRSAHS